MGINNKARRAAKARARAKQRAHQTRSQSRGWYDPYGEDISDVDGPGVASAGLSARRSPDRSQTDEHRAAAALAGMWLEWEIALHRLLEAIWRGGWQPVELVREIRRSTRGPWPVELVRRLISVDDARRDLDTLDPRWRSQVESLGLPTVPPGSGWLGATVRDDPDAHTSPVVALLETMSGLTSLPRLIPPPGGAAGDVDIDLVAAEPSDDQRDPVLERVRALLAQAESTNYPAEAEAFTAKAHELMTRHAIDAALVEDSTARVGFATAVRIPVDEPYLDSKSLLLQIVAEASRCRAVFHSRYAMSTVVGASNDLAAVQVLFTSLLLQAQQALLAEGANVAAGARQRSRTFRTSFLFAYANRIGERLAEVTASVVDDVEAVTGSSALPVLADRSRVVDEAVGRLFGDLTQSRVNAGWDAAGWSSGQRAADRARLSEAERRDGDTAPSLSRPGGPEQLRLAG